MKDKNDDQGATPSGSGSPLNSSAEDGLRGTAAIPSAEYDFTEDAWREEAVRLFGTDPMQWKFVCPVCNWLATLADWKEVGATEGEVAFSCIGRRASIPTRCNYAGGGLFRLNPVKVLLESGSVTTVFQFAGPDHVQPTKLSDFRQR